MYECTNIRNVGSAMKYRPKGNEVSTVEHHLCDLLN